MNKLTNTTKHVLSQSPRFQADSIRGGKVNLEGTMNILKRGCEETRFIEKSIGITRDNFNFMQDVTQNI
jgi:hypothetical protein